MKKSKLKIENLKIQSFVTAIEEEKSNTLKGKGTCFCTWECTRELA